MVIFALYNMWTAPYNASIYIQLYFTKHVVAENNKLNKTNEHTKRT